jgi:hypothetical protein
MKILMMFAVLALALSACAPAATKPTGPVLVDVGSISNFGTYEIDGTGAIVLQIDDVVRVQGSGWAVLKLPGKDPFICGKGGKPACSFENSVLIATKAGPLGAMLSNTSVSVRRLKR